MKILIAGGSGFVGAALTETLKASGHSVTLVTRRPERLACPSVGWGERELLTAAGEHDVLVNLAGEPLMGKRWNARQKVRLETSRVGSTKKLVEALKGAENKPACLLSASAVGFYGPRQDDDLTESAPGGGDFLSDLCKKWEREAFRAEDAGVRTVIVRLGIVLGRNGGALSKMLLPFKLGLGGPLGRGDQFMSWIHIRDLAGLFLLLMQRKEMRGVFNGTAPHPVTNREFTRSLARALGRKAFLRVPAAMLKPVMGDVAAVLLTGQKVLPQRAMEAGFAFQFPRVEEALRDLCS